MKAIAGTTIKDGDAVTIKPRPWKTRLFSWPWHPFTKYEALRLIIKDDLSSLENFTVTIKDAPTGKLRPEIITEYQPDYSELDKIGLQASKNGSALGKAYQNLEVIISVDDRLTPVMKRIFDLTFRSAYKPYRHMWE